MYQFSIHSLEQLAKRNITQEMALWIIENPTEITVEEGVTAYQNIILENNKTYLIRVFVNESKTPPLIITAYKTSKIQKY
ncbi:MAG: DUF4258 domain-containing protein [Deinococcales bacterium]|nr:DUF4258 domain-containing protein [Chitinophagaceae bacterium]